MTAAASERCIVKPASASSCCISSSEIWGGATIPTCQLLLSLPLAKRGLSTRGSAVRYVHPPNILTVKWCCRWGSWIGRLGWGVVAVVVVASLKL